MPGQVRLWQLAVAMLCGNLLLHQLPVLPGRSLLICLAVGAVSAFGRFPRIASALIAFCWTAWVAGVGLDARWPSAADGADVELLGWIDNMPVRDAGRTIFSLRVVGGDAQHHPRRVRLSWYDPAPALEAGQALEVVARLRAPRGLANPASFDYERWLFTEGYDATGYVRSGRIDAERDFGLAQNWLKVRAALFRRIASQISDPDAAVLVQALALGERSGFGDRHWTVLQRTGTSHLVAVSGLHIALIAALCYFPVASVALRLPYPLARRAHGWAAVASLGAATAYAALAGLTLPTRRALVMLLVLKLLIVARRRWPLGSGLGIALGAILLLDPLASLTASFWLSFGAVTLLLISAAGVEHPLPAPRHRVVAVGSGFCRLQLALTVGLAPLVIWFFGQFSFASLVVNLVAIPLFSFLIVPLSLLAAALAAIGDASSLMEPIGSIVAWVWRGLEWAAGLEFAAFAFPRPGLAALGLAIVAVVASVANTRWPGRRLLLLALLPLGFGSDERPPAGLARATIFDVGHGLAVAIETENHRVLYDAGPRFRSGFDVGAEIVVPWLSAKRGRGLDLLIISHGDSDHAGGAAAVVARYPRARVIAGPDVDQVEAENCTAGQSLLLDGVRFRFLHPPESTSLEGNDSSCVVLVETAAGSLLLTGDVEARAESMLVRGGDLEADVVVVPHHGSLTSSTARFVAAVKPDVAIVSAAYNNRWNFPRPEVRMRWLDAGAKLLVTGDLGAVTVVFGAAGITLSSLRYERRRYWQPEPGPVSGAADASAL